MSRLTRSVGWYVSWMEVGGDDESEAALLKRRDEADQLLRDILGRHFKADAFEALIHILDHECYCLETANNSKSRQRRNYDALEKPWTSMLVTQLSRCLFETIYPESYYERELQFRALFSALVLQRAQGAEARQVDHYEELQRQFQKGHKDLHWQRGWSGEFTKEKFRKYQCSFLLVATAEYSKNFRREQPIVVEILSRVIKVITAGGSLAVASTAGFGPGSLQSIIQTLDETFRPLSQTPGKRSEAIFILQEITRITLASDLYAKVITGAPRANRRDCSMVGSLRSLAGWILERILCLLDNENLEESVSHPAPVRILFLAFFDRGPPCFSKYYYVYGLLDCATQLARVLEREIVPSDFEEKMWRLIQNSKDPTLRWKAIEFLVLTGLWKEINDPVILSEVEVITACLNEESSSLPPQSIYSRKSSVSQDSLSKLPQMNPREWMEREEDFPSFEISTRVESSSMPFAKKFSSNYYSAGLSQDCSSAFFLSEKNVVVYSLENFPRVRETDVRLTVMPDNPDELKTAKATLTKRFLAIITRGKADNQLSIYRHSVPTENGREIGSENFHTWRPTCLTMHESRDRTWVAVGGQTNKDGSIRMYHIEEVRGKLSLKRHEAQFVLRDDWPKSLDFGPDCSQLTALTSYKNKVLVWFLSNNARPRQAVFEIQKRYEGGTMARGLESVSLFYAPSARPYVLCTTSPSNRRYENAGEWPFISPVHPGPCKVPKQLEHSFSALQKSEPIIAGAASARGHLVAMLENTGNVILCSLTRNENGGLCPSGRLVVLRKILAAQNSLTSSTCIRFHEDRGGEHFYLFAVDIKGNVIRKTFEKLDRG